MHMNDETKARLIEMQKQSFSLATITYNNGGFEPATATGYIGYSDLMAQQTPFGSVGKGALVAIVIQDVTESMFDQQQLQIPLDKIFSVQTAPTV